MRKKYFSFKDLVSSKNGQYSLLCCSPHIAPQRLSAWRPVSKLSVSNFGCQTYGLFSELILNHLFDINHSHLKNYFSWVP